MAEKYSDIIPHDQTPSFDELMAIFEKNFKAGELQNGEYTVEEVEQNWQRYKALNHLYQDEAAALKEKAEKISSEHADLNLALAAMLNGYQNLSAYQKEWFIVPPDLINQYKKMVLEYDIHGIQQEKKEQPEPAKLTPDQIAERKEAIEWYRNPVVSVEEIWDSFWKEIVRNEDGTVNIEQVKKELADFSFILEQVPKVYCHITGNKMSKVIYHAEDVIKMADDHFNEELEQAVKDELGDREAGQGAVWVKASVQPPVCEPLCFAKIKDNLVEGDERSVILIKDIAPDRWLAIGLQLKLSVKIDDIICWLDESGIATTEPFECAFVPCEDDDPRCCGGYTSNDGQSLCHVREVNVAAVSGKEEIKWGSKELIGRSQERYEELLHKRWDWSSFYNGWIEGRADMLEQIKGLGRYKEPHKEKTVIIMQWAFANIKAWDKSTDTVMLYDDTKCSSAQLYDIFKQQNK